MSSYTWRFSVKEMPFGVTTWPARVSIPLPAGANPDMSFAIVRPDGSFVPAQARTLVKWPDGSPRWVQLDFQANAVGDHLVRTGKGDSAIALPINVSTDGEEIAVSVGRLQVTCTPNGVSPLQGIAWNGRRIAAERIGDFRVIDDAGRVFSLAAGVARAVTVEASGEQRYQLSWETEHRDAAGNRLLDVRFRLEFLAGVEGFSLTYHFFHKLPGREMLHLQAIEGDFHFSDLSPEHGHGLVVQQSQGLLGTRRVARTRNTMPILVDDTRLNAYIEDPRIVGDDFAYPYFLANSGHAVSPVVALEDDHVAMTLAMRDLEDMRPKTITVSPGAVRYGIWPRRAGTLDLPQGRSCSQRFSLRFSDPGAAQVDDCLLVPKACYLEPAIGWLHPADSVHAGASWDAPRLFTSDEPGAGLFAAILSEATGRYQSVSRMFDFGDSPHTGYTTSYAGTGMRPNRQTPFTAAIGSGVAHTALVAPQDLEPVWANNEYDAIYALALEALRTQSSGVLTKLRAVSRHQLEVDFVHYSDHWQHHRGTPCHTYDHTACSTAYPSHQWTQGLYYYYCLTGDDDVPEVVRAICDYNLMWLAIPELQFVHYFNRELGWGAIALVFGYELTGDDKYREAAKQVIKELEQYAGRTNFDEQMKMSKSAGGSQNERLLGRAFAVNTIPMAVRVYHQATLEEWAKELLFDWVEIGFRGYNEKSSGPKVVDMFPECFTYVCELTGETRYLRESLWHLTMFLYGYGNLWHGSGLIDAKIYGRQYRGLVHNVSACAKAGLLAQVEAHFLGESPVGATGENQ